MAENQIVDESINEPKPITPEKSTLLTTGLEDYGRWKTMFQDKKRDPKEPPFRRGRIWC